MYTGGAGLPVFCISFLDVGRGDGPTEFVTVGGYGTRYTSWAVGRGLRVVDMKLGGHAAKRFQPRQYTRGAPCQLVEAQRDGDRRAVLLEAVERRLLVATGRLANHRALQAGHLEVGHLVPVLAAQYVKPYKCPNASGVLSSLNRPPPRVMS